MFRVAVFIDAGYLWKQLSKALCPGDSKNERSSVSLDCEKFRLALLNYVTKTFPDIPLLRCYWYDGPLSDGTRSPDHNNVARLNDFKLKLGSRVTTEDGKVRQKGVDGLIIADLIGLAQNKVLSHALLISGDGDMVPGVSAAQSLGIRINLLGLFAEEATSPYLRMEADSFELWGPTEIAEFAISRSATAAPSRAVESRTDGEKTESDNLRGDIASSTVLHEGPGAEGNNDAFARTLEGQVTNFYGSLDAQEKSSITGVHVPHDIDRRLIRFGYEHNGYRALDESQKREMRRVLKRLAK